jgi:hypothetical protein
MIQVFNIRLEVDFLLENCELNTKIIRWKWISILGHSIPNKILNFILKNSQKEVKESDHWSQFYMRIEKKYK